MGPPPIPGAPEGKVLRRICHRCHDEVHRELNASLKRE
jgi:hypothetical protein